MPVRLSRSWIPVWHSFVLQAASAAPDMDAEDAWKAFGAKHVFHRPSDYVSLYVSSLIPFPGIRPYDNHPQWIHIISDFNPGKAEPEVHTWEKHGKTIYVFCLTGDDFFGTCGFAAMSTYHCSLQNFRSVMQLFKSLMVIMNQMVSIKTWKVMNIYASWIIILIIVRCCSIWSIFVVFPMKDLKARNNILLMRLEDVGGIQPFQRLRSPC